MNAEKRLRIVAISPHQDDVALSITYFLDVLSGAAGVSCLELVSCFSQSEYTPFADRFPTSQIPEIRSREDAAYLRQLRFSQTSLRCLGLLDAPLRPEWKPGADIHDPTHYRSIDAVELNAYVRPLADLLRRQQHRDALFVAPLGIGHKDHMITNGAVTSALAGLPLIFYEDAPYIFQLSDTELKGVVKAVQRALGEGLLPVEVPSKGGKQRWVACVSAYESQFTVSQLDQFAESFQTRAGERLWATASAMALLKAAGARGLQLQPESD